MSKHFLNAVHQGHNHWWRYGLVIMAIASYWLFFSSVINPLICWMICWIVPSGYLQSFVFIFLSFILVLAILMYGVTKLHRRNFRSLINADNLINVQRLKLGFLVWGIQLSFFTLIEILIHPNDYSYNLDILSRWLAFLPLALVLVPIQTSAEEFFFRGYLMQGLSLISKHRLFLILVTSLAFAVPHFANPEMQRGFVWGAMNYFTWGVFFALITLKDNGLELALGVHAVNNLFSLLIVNTPDSVLPTPSLMTYIQEINSGETFLSLLLQATIFYFIFFGGITRTPTPEK